LDEFFSKGDLFDLTGILKHSEQTTSCEVVVRITSDRVMMEETARAEYTQLGLDRSNEKTGLLLYINLFHRKFIFLAGDSIVDKLGEEWLQKYADMLEERFRKYQFGFGLHDVVARIGLDLKESFPVVPSDQ
jgi:uncharacterized membrane protein